MLGCDLVVTGTKKVLASVKEGQTALVVNTAEVMPGEFTRNADFSLPTERLKRAIKSAAGAEGVSFVDATAVATALLGNAIAANMFMLGYAYQTGRVPLSGAAIEKAIELNGEAVKMNLAAFTWGRRAAAEPELIAGHHERAEGADGIAQALRDPGRGDRASRRRSCPTIRTRVTRGATAVSSSACAKRRTKAVPGSTALTDAVARSLFKLMAYKDEYEVARLYTNGHFEKQVASAFEGENLRYEFHMAPPLLAKKDPVTGLPRKMSFGPWMLKAMGVLAKFKAAARHAARRLRLHPRAPHRAPAHPRVRGADRRRSWRSSMPAIMRPPSGSPASRRRSAASATSRSGT